jgi:MinD superfamily P-loop ATPase
MKEITILSGKGGTGKTSIAAALGSVAKSVVFCDCDVDAADLHLIFQPEIDEENPFHSGWTMAIDPEKCTDCNICIDYCRFEAIQTNEKGNLTINPFKCEGCRLCERICPSHAIFSDRNRNSHWFVSSTRFGTLVHAKMGAGEENSGKLVAHLRKKAREIAQRIGLRFIINDGPPGIGCASIASFSGSDLVLIVTEPTKSGLHDTKRLVDLIHSFEVEAFAIINKYDISYGITREILDFLKTRKIQVIARLPFDHALVEAMNAGKSITEYCPEHDISKKIIGAWSVITN